MTEVRGHEACIEPFDCCSFKPIIAYLKNEMIEIPESYYTLNNTLKDPNSESHPKLYMDIAVLHGPCSTSKKRRAAEALGLLGFRVCFL